MLRARRLLHNRKPNSLQRLSPLVSSSPDPWVTFARPPTERRTGAGKEREAPQLRRSLLKPGRHRLACAVGLFTQKMCVLFHQNQGPRVQEDTTTSRRSLPWRQTKSQSFLDSLKAYFFSCWCRFVYYNIPRAEALAMTKQVILGGETQQQFFKTVFGSGPRSNAFWAPNSAS